MAAPCRLFFAFAPSLSSNRPLLTLFFIFILSFSLPEKTWGREGQAPPVQNQTSADPKRQTPPPASERGGIKPPTEVQSQSSSDLGNNCNLDYEIESISNSFLRFSGNGAETVTIVIRAKNGPWDKNCSLKLTPAQNNGTLWIDQKNQEHQARGFSQAEDFLKLEILSGDQAEISPNGQTATFSVEVLPQGGAGRAMEQFRVNGEIPSQNGIYGIYVYGESPSPDERNFLTSVSDVAIRNQPLNEAKKLEELFQNNTPLTATGKAVRGEYSSTYKGYMWYPVRTQGGTEGFVEAGAVREEKVELNLITNTNAYNTHKSEENKSLTLHFTISNGSKENVRAGWQNPATQVSAHYVIGKTGDILQTVQDFHRAYHAGNWNVNQSSIGLEIINWGRAFNSLSGGYVKWGGNTAIEASEVIDLTGQPVLDIWTHPNNYNEQQNGIYKGQNLGKGPLWHRYTEGQYQALIYLLSYLEERYDLPHQIFDHPIPPLNLDPQQFSNQEQQNGYPGYQFFYHPEQGNEKGAYFERLENFYGVNGHHNTSGKYDPGPHLDLSFLHFKNIP